MKTIITLEGDKYPPLLRMYVFGAPHRRQHVAVIKSYREEILAAAREAGINYPIKHPVELWVLFIDPSSTDLGNSYLALERALDSKSLGCVGLLQDDGLIQKTTMAKFYPEGERK